MDDGRRNPLITSMATGRSIAWLLDTRAAQRPHHPFVVWEPRRGPSEQITYADFVARVERVAAGLRRRGVTKDAKVVIHMENCPEFLVSWFALTRIGAVAVCTNTRSSVEELRHYGDHSGSIAAITQPKFAASVAAAMPALRWIAVTDTDAGDDPDPATEPSRADSFDSLASDVGDRDFDGAAAELHPLDPAWIQYTSGTTSRPKAVVLTHGNALWGAKLSAFHEDLRRDDVHLVHLPLFHINALCYSVLGTLWSGATFVLMPRFSASRFWDVSLRHGCTWASMIPFAITALGDRDIPSDHSYRIWGAGAVVPQVESLFGVKILSWYGMTETVTHPIVGELHGDAPAMSMGRPSPEYDIALLDASGRPVAPGETGGVYVRGTPGLSLFKEYLHDPQATRDAVDEAGWLNTGDRATLHDDGFMSFADRDKDMLKVGGENVAASEIERIISEVAGVGEVAVVAARHRMLDQVPVAFVIPNGPDADDQLAARVLDACRTRLADFKVPRDVHVVDEMPRSMLNKVAKAELRAMLPELE